MDYGKFLKRGVATTMAFVIATSLVGCGGNKGTEPTETTPTTVTAMKLEKAKKTQTDKKPVKDSKNTKDNKDTKKADPTAPTTKAETKNPSKGTESNEVVSKPDNNGGSSTNSGSSSNNHTPKPTEPAPKPTQPTPKPTEPAPKPTQPTPKPTEPAPKPTEPAPKPTEPAPKPTEPKPTEPAPKPTEPPHVHQWTKIHHDAVTEAGDVIFICTVCPWSCTESDAAAAGMDIGSYWYIHHQDVEAEKNPSVQHSYTTDVETVVVEEAYDEWVCSCGESTLSDPT